MNGMDVRPLTPDRWGDVLHLFGDNGAYANCWCMWWRTTSAEFSDGIRDRGAGNRAAFETLVKGDERPGLLAYVDGTPAGWVSVAPREQFGRLQRSPKLRPVDAEPVWSITCFFVARSHRGGGVGRALLDAAVEHAAARGAGAVEGYPVVSPVGAPAAFTGTVSMFADAGFAEIARRGGRPIMRRAVAR
jgi:GNAT superfamily N-acetyltransferase